MSPIDDDDKTLESRFRSAAAMIPAHGDVNDIVRGRAAQVRSKESSRPNRHFAGYATAAGLVLLVGGLAAIRNQHNSGDVAPAQSPSTTPTTEPDQPLPVRGVKYATAMTSLGVVELYDSTKTSEKCFTLALADGSDLADCFPNQSVHDGTAYDYLRKRPQEPGLLVGLLDPGSTVRIQIGNTSTAPDEHGIWVAQVPEGVDTFVVVTAGGPQTFRIQQAG